MAKKIDIGSKGFTKAVAHLSLQPSKGIIKCLDSKLFPLDSNGVFNYRPEYLGSKEFESSCDLIHRRIGENANKKSVELKIGGLFNFINKQEKQIREELKKLAVETIRNIYNVPPYVDLQAFIEDRINLDTEQDHNPDPFLDLSLEEKNSMRDEIQKRVILNGIVHGSSMHIWKSVYHLVRDQITELNPMLLQLYNEYTAGINFLFWTKEPKTFESAVGDQQQLTQGYNKLEFEEPGKHGVKITCKAINFPTLLHELNKGVMDYLICHGIPKEYSEEQLIYYYSKADRYENEFWHYILSPTLWVDLLETADVEQYEIPGVVMRLSKLPYQILVEIFRAMMDDKKKAKVKLEVWKVI